jgi:hypothetical protein
MFGFKNINQTPGKAYNITYVKPHKLSKTSDDLTTPADDSSGTDVEVKSISLNPSETTGLRCRITPSPTDVPAVYDSEKQAVSCLLPKVRITSCIDHYLSSALLTACSFEIAKNQESSELTCYVYTADGKNVSANAELLNDRGGPSLCFK